MGRRPTHRHVVAGTTPHFDGYPAVLIVLAEVDPTELAELVVEAWVCRAPKRAVRAFEAHPPAAPGG